MSIKSTLLIDKEIIRTTAGKEQTSLIDKAAFDMSAELWPIDSPSIQCSDRLHNRDTSRGWTHTKKNVYILCGMSILSPHTHCFTECDVVG